MVKSPCNNYIFKGCPLMNKTKKTDLLFVVSLLSVLLIHILFVFVIPFSQDEYVYVSIPFRLFNGDSLVQDEWHLTQFSSLFSSLPVYIWMALKGTADGIFVFLRSVYLLIHTTIAIVVYGFFRKHGKWAVLASMLFYVQIAYRIQAISYQSMFVNFLLLMTLCLITIYKKQSVKSYILAGICLGCCCVCNPFFCFAFAIYLIGCFVWTKRVAIIENIVKIKTTHTSKSEKKPTKKQKKEQKQQLVNNYPDAENFNCFFNKNAILLFTIGILVVAVIAISFFFLTGGTIDSIFDNIENLLGSSEYDIASDSIFSKLADTLTYFSMANLHMPWILPVLFLSLLLDKKKKDNRHRIIYLAVSILWSLIFILGVMFNIEVYICALSLPFFVTSTICYILTEKKNKMLFYCMHIPCSIAMVFHYLAGNTHLGVIGIVLAISNIAGVFFVKDLLKEIRCTPTKESDTRNSDSTKLIKGVIITSICLQFLFYGWFYQYGQIYGIDAPKASSGPFKHLYMSEQQYTTYNKIIADMDIIKSISNEDDPVLIAAYNHWAYLYLDRPIATYSTWYRGTLYTDQLTNYYKENPEKIPRYIYIESSDPKNTYTDVVNDLFQYTRQDLSNGVLLTVTYCNF